MASAHEVARYIIRFFQEAGDPVTNLKLQKLLYYVQGWHLALRGDSAFPENLEAWVHGPVQSSIYGTYKHNRWSPINEEVAPATLSDALKEVIDSVLETYGGDTGFELELRTHQEFPWLQARGNLLPDAESRNVISVESMKKFFSSLRDGQAQ